jgi:hypothetical protein
MVIINHHIQRAMPFGQFDKQLREKGGQAGVLALLHHHFTGDAVSIGGLLNGGNQIAGKTLLLVIALIKEYQPRSFLPAAHCEMSVVFP